MTYENDVQDAQRFLQAGNYKRSLKAALSAVKKSPRSAMASNIAGIAASASGHPSDAIKYFQKAIALNPDFADAKKNLAQTLIVIGRADTALAVLVRLSKSTPDDWKVWYLKAQAELALGKEKDGLASVQSALAIQPETLSVYHLRSLLNLSLGRIKDAIDDLYAVLNINPADVVALTNLSLPLARQTRSQEALDVVQKAVELDPSNVAARYRLATQFVEMGQWDEGIFHYNAILELEPEHPAALEQLTLLLPKAQVAALEPKIQTALKKVPKNSENRASLFYALSTALSAAEKTADAEKTLGLANKEMANLLRYVPAADADVTRAILGRFPTELKIEGDTPAGPSPIFVIGLPRSGTTLVEAVLGGHPHVTPLGERGTAGFLLRDTIERDLPFTALDAAEMVLEDQRLLPDLPERTVAYVDKMPENYRLVGFLKLAYPNCRIINVRRDPRDIALSMWKSHFSGTALSYTYDWDWMAFRFNLYAQSMAHWKSVLPGQIFDVDYKELVKDVEGTGRRMAEFCDLEWQSAMARPDLSTTQILTQSATQLRRPVHTDSVDKWRKHTDLLERFVNGLDRKLWHDYLKD